LTRRYKVAFVISSFNRGGKELILLNVLRAMDATRFEPMLFVAKGGGDLLDEDTGGKVYVGIQTGNALRSLPALWKMLTQERPDVVWCVAAGVTGFAGRLFARILRTPAIVISLHGRQGWRIMDWPNRFITRLTTHRVVTTSQEFGRVLLQEGIPQPLLQVIHNGIDTSQFQPTDDRGVYKQRILDIEPIRPVIGTVGSLRPIKAQHVLLNAAPSVLAEWPDALFVMAGDGPSRAELEGLCRQLSIEKHVRFLGLRKDIPDLLRSFDVFVLTSNDESFGNAIVEAMASGLPVVSTAVGGVPEIITDETGILVRAGDDKAVAKAVIELLHDPARREAMRQAGRQRVIEHFSLESAVRAREALLLELLEPASGSNW
jgi:glycosyltransferase involved in cell wall biosynthesis